MTPHEERESKIAKKNQNKFMHHIRHLLRLLIAAVKPNSKNIIIIISMFRQLTRLLHLFRGLGPPRAYRNAFVPSGIPIHPQYKKIRLVNYAK
jgi:hypothetical protein